MVDIHDKATRSYNMSQIKGKNTKPEIKVRKFLFSHGFRFRIHDKKLPGKPDIVLPKYRTIIFVQGCFWHGHEHCKYFKLPSTRHEWWKAKIEKNISNDKKTQETLKQLGYKIIVVWECQIKNDSFKESLIEDVRK